MRIAIGSDHAGFRMKQRLRDDLASDFEVLDLGTDSEEPVDYPDYAEAVALAVRDATACRGIVVCGSGVGASIAANKVPGIRAGLCHDTYSARQGVEHDDMNILVLGSRVVGIELALTVTRAFLASTFDNDERHVRRLAKIESIELGYRWGVSRPGTRTRSRS